MKQSITFIWINSGFFCWFTPDTKNPTIVARNEKPYQEQITGIANEIRADLFHISRNSDYKAVKSPDYRTTIYEF